MGTLMGILVVCKRILRVKGILNFVWISFSFRRYGNGTVV